MLITMANISDLNTVISDLFGVLGTLITGIVDLLTGDLLVLAVVGAFIAFIIGVIYGLLAFVKKHMDNSVKMKNK